MEYPTVSWTNSVRELAVVVVEINITIFFLNRNTFLLS